MYRLCWLAPIRCPWPPLLFLSASWKMHYNSVNSPSWKKKVGVEGWGKKLFCHAGEQNVSYLISADLWRSKWKLNLWLVWATVCNSYCIDLLGLCACSERRCSVCTSSSCFQNHFNNRWFHFLNHLLDSLAKRKLHSQRLGECIAPSSASIIILMQSRNPAWKRSFCCSICFVSIVLAVQLFHLSLLSG